jgi:putative flippase GtrA
MQKFWTFRDNKVHDIKLQMSRYLIVILFSLILNTVLIYVLVEILTIWYLTAQIIATVIIAVTNFFCYQHFVFKERTLIVNSNSVL